MSTPNTLATITRRGPDLVIETTSEVLADSYWQDRRDLLRITGQQRLQLLIHLEPESGPLQLFWQPDPLPVSFNPPPTFRQP